MKKYLIIGGIALALAALGFAFGRYSAPTKIKEVEKIKIVEVEKKKSNEKKNVVTVTTQKPDGTTVIETRDTSTTTTVVDTNTNTTNEKTKTTTFKKPDWRVAGMIGVGISSLDVRSNLIYGGSVSRRILGPISVGAWGLSNGTLGVSVSLEF